MSRTTHSTALPYSRAQWPSISSDTEQAILALLLPLLRPLGDLRKSCARPSRGRNRAKRKTSSPINDRDAQDAPQLSQHVTIGLTSTYRSLEAQARRVRAEASDPGVSLAVVFVCRDFLPEPACDSLPLLLTCASTSTTALRLVPMTERAAISVASALHLPRASMVGIGGEAAGSRPLMQYIRDNIAAIKVDGPSQDLPPVRYLPLKVTAREIPVEKKKKSAATTHQPVEGNEHRAVTQYS